MFCPVSGRRAVATPPFSVASSRRGESHMGLGFGEAPSRCYLRHRKHLNKLAHNILDGFVFQLLQGNDVRSHFPGAIEFPVKDRPELAEDAAQVPVRKWRCAFSLAIDGPQKSERTVFVRSDRVQQRKRLLEVGRGKVEQIRAYAPPLDGCR